MDQDRVASVKSTNVRLLIGSAAVLTAAVLSAAGCASTAAGPPLASADPTFSIAGDARLAAPPRDCRSYQSR